MSYGIELVPGGPMPFRQLKYLLMSTVGDFPAPGSWQVLPPSVYGGYLYSPSNEVTSQPKITSRLGTTATMFTRLYQILYGKSLLTLFLSAEATGIVSSYRRLVLAAFFRLKWLLPHLVRMSFPLPVV